MTTRLKNLWETIRQSLWLIPALSISAAVLLAIGMAYLDEYVAANWNDAPFLNRSGPDTALSIIGTVTSSMITVAGVTFSITIVALTLASSQFGPRLLRNFLRSLPSQITFAALIGAFVYGITLMPSVDTHWQVGDPHPSVTLIIVMAAVCVCLLVYYLHHVATSIQADSLIAKVYQELEEHIDALDDETEESPRPSAQEPQVAQPSISIKAWKSGYINAIDCSGLTEWAREANCLLLVRKRPGKFLHRGEAFVEIAATESTPDPDHAAKALKEGIYLSRKRTPEQDVEFLIDQLVEIALRALSPGINDPNTALICIDYLSAAMSQFANKRLPPSLYRDPSNEARLWVSRTDFDGLFNNAFDQIRQSAATHPEVVIRLLDSLATLAVRFAKPSAQHAATAVQFEKMAPVVKDSQARSACDQRDVERAAQRCRDALSRPDGA